MTALVVAFVSLPRSETTRVVISLKIVVLPPLDRSFRIELYRNIARSRLLCRMINRPIGDLHDSSNTLCDDLIYKKNTLYFDLARLANLTVSLIKFP